MNVALAFLDAEPNRMLGLDVLEAMLCGAPVLVSAQGGAAREHAESGNGGSWYRSDAELRACLEALPLGGSSRGARPSGPLVRRRRIRKRRPLHRSGARRDRSVKGADVARDDDRDDVTLGISRLRSSSAGPWRFRTAPGGPRAPSLACEASGHRYDLAVESGRSFGAQGSSESCAPQPWPRSFCWRA